MIRGDSYRSSGNIVLRCCVLCLCLSVLSFPSMASEPEMTARPGLCILEPNEQSMCRMDVAFEWRSQLDEAYCLHSSQEEEALHCWQPSYSGQVRVALEAEQDVSFWLQQAGRQVQLATIRIRVLHKEPRNKRWRRRHPWSIF